MGADRKVISIFCAFVLCVSSVLEGNNQEMDGRAILSVVFFHPVPGISSYLFGDRPRVFVSNV